MRSAPKPGGWLLPLLIASLAASLAAGCGGGGDSDEDGVRAALEGYFGGLARGEGEEACSHVSSNGRLELAEVAAFSGINSISCVAVVEEIAGGIGADDADRLTDIEVSGIRINGNRARATIAGATITPTLIRSKDGWLIDGGFLQAAGRG